MAIIYKCAKLSFSDAEACQSCVIPSQCAHWRGNPFSPAVQSTAPPLAAKDADCHTSDIGHWFAMTPAGRIAVTPLNYRLAIQFSVQRSISKFPTIAGRFLWISWHINMLRRATRNNIFQASRHHLCISASHIVGNLGIFRLYKNLKNLCFVN